MFESFKRSFQLVKESMKVLKQDKELLLFPVFSGLALFAVFISFIIPFSMLGFENKSMLEVALWMFGFYFISYFVIIFFNTALISCANIRFSGKNPKISDGLGTSASNIGKIFGWAAIAATVGLILKMLQNQAQKEEGFGGLIASMLVGAVGMAWSLLTFFVIPVMVFEKKGVFASIKRSGQLLKTTWGENIVATGSIGLVFFLLWVVGFVPLVAMYFLGASLQALIIGGIVFIVYWMIIATLQASLNGIFTAALYHYATTGNMPDAYKYETKHYFAHKER